MDNIQTKPTTSTIKLNNYKGFFQKGISTYPNTKLEGVPYAINGTDYYERPSNKESFCFSSWDGNFVLVFKYNTKTGTKITLSNNSSNLGILFYADDNFLYGSSKRLQMKTVVLSDNPWNSTFSAYVPDTNYRIIKNSNSNIVTINSSSFTYTTLFTTSSIVNCKRGFLHSNCLYFYYSDGYIKKYNLTTKTITNVFNPKMIDVDAIGIVLEYKEEPIIFINTAEYSVSSLNLFTIDGTSLNISILGNGYYFNGLNSISINKFEMFCYNKNVFGMYFRDFNYQRDKYFLPISKGSSNIFQKTIFSKDEQKINANTTFSASTNNNYGTQYDSITGSSSINGEFYTFEN